MLLGERDARDRIPFDAPAGPSRYRALLAYLRDLEHPELGLPLDTWYGMDKRGYPLRWHVLAEIQTLWRLLAEGLFLFRAGPGCRFCDAEAACRKLDFAARFRQENEPHPAVRLFFILLDAGIRQLAKDFEQNQQLLLEISND